MDSRKVIRRIFLFLLPIIIVFLYMEYKLSKIPNTYTQKRIYFERSKDSVQVLFLGGSQILFGVNPADMSAKSFNLADYDQPFYYDEKLLLKYINQMPALKLVIMSNTYYSLYYTLQHSPEPWRAFYYSRFWGIHSDFTSKWDSRNYSYLALYTPYVSISYVLKFFKVNLAENMNDYGYISNDTAHNAANIGDSLGRKNVELHNTIIDTNNYAQIFKGIDELVYELQKRGIKVVFITPPVLPTYYRYCEQYIVEKNVKTFEFLSEKYKTTYFNYFSDPRFTKSCFEDNQHLNFIGAQKFTKTIDSEIVIPFFKKEISMAN